MLRINAREKEVKFINISSHFECILKENPTSNYENALL